MSVDFSVFTAKKHFGSLDGLRALSIVGVVWHHADRGHHLFFAEQGAMGVPLFFVISGFLITTLLIRERSRTGDISLKAFYARRSLRIFPLYYTVLLAYVVIVALGERDAHTHAEFFHNLWFYVSYTSNWFVRLDSPRVIFYFAWSLATEEQFYLLWPSVEKFLSRAPVVVAAILVAAWIGAQTDVIGLAHDSLLRTIVLSFTPAICMGVALAHALHNETSFALCAPVLGWKWGSPLLLVAVVVLLLQPVSTATTLLTFLAMTFLVGACVVREDHALAPWLKLKPVESVGRVSYGIYLMHMLALNVVERILRQAGIDTRAVVFPAALIVAWGVAWLSFTCYEARFLKLKERFAR